MSFFFNTLFFKLMSLLHQHPAGAETLPHLRLRCWVTTASPARRRSYRQWGGDPTLLLTARPPPKHAFVLLQRLGQLTVEHLELGGGRRHGQQRSHQPHQLSGQLLHCRQRTPGSPAGRRRCRRHHEWVLPLRWVVGTGDAGELSLRCFCCCWNKCILIGYPMCHILLHLYSFPWKMCF